MRHAKARHQFNRFTSWRDATLKSIARNLLIQQSIKTTKSKAKAAQPLLEQLITLAKTNTLFAKRQAYRILGDHKLVSLLFSDIGQRFANRVGGYTRIIGFGTRRGDIAELVIFELSEIEEPKKEEAKTEKPVSGAEAQAEEKKTKTAVAVKEKPPETKKPTKKFLGGIRNIFKKERDSL